MLLRSVLCKLQTCNLTSRLDVKTIYHASISYIGDKQSRYFMENRNIIHENLFKMSLNEEITTANSITLRYKLPHCLKTPEDHYPQMAPIL